MAFSKVRNVFMLEIIDFQCLFSFGSMRYVKIQKHQQHDTIPKFQCKWCRDKEEKRHSIRAINWTTVWDSFILMIEDGDTWFIHPTIPAITAEVRQNN